MHHHRLQPSAALWPHDPRADDGASLHHAAAVPSALSGERWGALRHGPARLDVLLSQAFGGHADSVAISARAIAAEDELVLVAVEESAHEIRVAVERVIAGIRRHVAVQVRKIGEPFVGETAGFDPPPGVGDVFGHISADVRPEGVGVAQDGRARVSL